MRKEQGRNAQNQAAPRRDGAGSAVCGRRNGWFGSRACRGALPGMSGRMDPGNGLRRRRLGSFPARVGSTNPTAMLPRPRRGAAVSDPG